MCPQQYFLEYVLGMKSPSNKKADKGTICHKALEILAVIKQGLQNEESVVQDDILGSVHTTNYSLDTIIEQVYQYYTSNFTHHVWEEKDYKDCKNWVYKALTDNNGNFDPRTRNIIQPEQRFDIVIDKPWAKYKYTDQNTILEGSLAIKGTIDLITQVSDDTLEIIDWKTGKRLDWATGKPKTLEKLHDDAQLRIYHYAISKIYPQYKHLIVSIDFINDGGVFSICFDESDLSKTEDMLRAKFEIIKNTQVPHLNKTWKCSKLCHFGKSTFAESNILPIVEYRDHQTTKIDQCMTKCEQVKHDIDIQGVNNVIDKYRTPGYTVGKYKAPGTTE